MYLTRTGINAAMALAAMAIIVISPDGRADNVGKLPATKHQQQAVEGMPEAHAAKGARDDAARAHRDVLGGDQEVPAVVSEARGRASIRIDADKLVTGSVTTTGIEATAAHIHGAPVGKNGPVLITLVRDGDHDWRVPPNARLTAAQYASYQAGELYVNVHSVAREQGEIRTQLVP